MPARFIFFFDHAATRLAGPAECKRVRSFCEQRSREWDVQTWNAGSTLRHPSDDFTARLWNILITNRPFSRVSIEIIRALNWLSSKIKIIVRK